MLGDSPVCLASLLADHLKVSPAQPPALVTSGHTHTGVARGEVSSGSQPRH